MVRHNIDPASLRGFSTFFHDMVKPSFGMLGLREDGIVDYVVQLLVRFARMDQLYRIRNVKGKRLETIAEMMIELARQWEAEVPYRFDRELEIRRHCGDYALFMSGLFRTHVERHSLLDYYLTEGRSNYRTVAELKQMAFTTDAKIYQALASEFEHISHGLDYMRKVYLVPQLNRGEYRDLLRNMELETD